MAVDVVPPVTGVDRSVQALPVVAVAHGRSDHDLVLGGQAGQRDTLTVEAGEVDLHVVERDLVEPVRLHVKERRRPRLRAGKPHRASGLKGLGTLGKIELYTISGDVDEGRSCRRFHASQVRHPRTLPEDLPGGARRSVPALPAQALSAAGTPKPSSPDGRYDPPSVGGSRTAGRRPVTGTGWRSSCERH